MSVEGVRKNLGTLLECEAESTVDIPAAVSAIDLSACAATNEKLVPIGDDYAQSPTSKDERATVSVASSHDSTSSHINKCGAEHRAGISRQESEEISVLPLLEDENKVAQTSGKKQRKSFTTGSSGNRRQSPFSSSRLNLIAFLNNIATSSNASPSSGAGNRSKTHIDQRPARSQSVSVNNGGGPLPQMSATASPGNQQKLPITSASPFPLQPVMCVEEASNNQQVEAQMETEKAARHSEGQSIPEDGFGSLLKKHSIGSTTSGVRAAVGGVCHVSDSLAYNHACAAETTSGSFSQKAEMDVSLNSEEISSLNMADMCSSSSSTTAAVCNNKPQQKSRECPVCCTRQSSSNFPRLTNCGHRSCKSCLIKYLQVEIMESRTAISCPECSELLHANDIYSLLEALPSLIERFECFSLRRVLSTDPDTRWCPAPDCSYAVIANSCAACPQLKCERPGCGAMFCYHCKNYWHANQTCDQAREGGFFRELVDSSGGGTSSKNEGRRKSGDMMKACPRCGALIVKMNDGSCNHMVCALCGVEFCWLCLKQINELHYLSPTGCTFWGKKPWSRKKKLLWQIGTLIGAPLGIALIAGLAVPGIICGVPIFVGRKTYQRFSNLTRTKRHLITAVSVAGSLLVSPVLAVMAVGVGVPIMLAYVYGVVPLSLCRNGGCGNSSNGADTSDSAYGEDEEDNALLTNARTSDAQERSRLLRVFHGTSSNTKKVKEIKSHKQKLDVTLSDRSAASSPSNGCGSSTDVTSEKFRRCSSGAGGVTASRAKSISTVGGGSMGASRSDAFSTSVSAYRHHRRQSTESGINSLGEKINTEDASVKAIAGSQYYDDRSVHTIWSNSALQAEISSYNEDAASTMACGGSVMESRSLAESACALPHLSVLSRERDVSPTTFRINPTGDSDAVMVSSVCSMPTKHEHKPSSCSITVDVDEEKGQGRQAAAAKKGKSRRSSNGATRRSFFARLFSFSSNNRRATTETTTILE